MSKRKPTNPITKIRTGSGDNGTTVLKEPGVPKDSLSVELVGTLDEACASLGRVELGFDFGGSDECDIQFKLADLYHNAIESFFVMGAMIHSEEAKVNNIQWLHDLQAEMEAAMNIVIENEYVEPLNGFIIPNEENGDLMLARAVIRRCERVAVTAQENDIIPFLNTLSDFVFLLSWYTGHYAEEWTGFATEGSPRKNHGVKSKKRSS